MPQNQHKKSCQGTIVMVIVVTVTLVKVVNGATASFQCEVEVS